MPLSRDPAARARQLANLRRSGPPAPSGNQFARRHGAYARLAAEELEGKTREIFDALAADAPVRTPDGALPAPDALVVRLLAECLVRRERVHTETLKHGLENRDGSLRGIAAFGLRLDEQALALCRELGLTPAARAKLGVDLVRGLAAIDQLDAHLAETYGGAVDRRVPEEPEK